MKMLRHRPGVHSQKFRRTSNVQVPRFAIKPLPGLGLHEYEITLTFLEQDENYLKSDIWHHN